jgi:hypothetical protein
MMRKIREDNKADPDFMSRHPLANTLLFNVQLQFMYGETSKRYGEIKSREYLYDMMVEMQMLVAHGKALDTLDVGDEDEVFEVLFSKLM